MAHTHDTLETAVRRADTLARETETIAETIAANRAATAVLATFVGTVTFAHVNATGALADVDENGATYCAGCDTYGDLFYCAPRV